MGQFLHMKPLVLPPAERAFFGAVARVVVANPFSSERAAAERELDDGASAGRIERIRAALEQRLAALERSGPAPLARCAPEERAALAHAYLFALYHASSAAFNEHIAAQEAAPDEPCGVPFAAELLKTLQSRGFTHLEALKNLALFFQLRRTYTFIDRALTGESACMRGLREALWNNIFTRDIRAYEAWLWERMEDFSTLFLGETGSGKGSAAQALGQSGFIPFDERRGRFAESFARTFLAVNLAEFPESLLEAELFGHEKGAFTGALERRDGVFAASSGNGAIFLDEVGELGAPVQIKLLRVLQERVFTPVGSRRARRFRGRVIAATNRGLTELRAGLLREDFYYRLCSDVIVMPPLRARLAEAPGELESLVRKLLERTLGTASDTLVAPVCEALARDLGPRHPWPGNVRELEQCVRRVLLTGRCSTAGSAPGASSDDPFVLRMAGGELDADELLGGYCARLLARLGTLESVAQRTRLDRRTVKRYADLGRAPRAP